MEKLEFSDIPGGSINGLTTLENCLAVSNKFKYRLPYDLAILLLDIHSEQRYM